MKQIIVVFLILFSFLSAASAELSCLCFEDSISHDSRADHAEERSSDQQDHCHHTCNQCHFAALVPAYFNSQVNYFLTYTVFFTPSADPRGISISLYRPPIS